MGLLILRSSVAAQSEFSDSFAANANPLASPWVKPNVANFFDAQAIGGIACGTVASDTGYPDCYAFHSGYTGDYEIEAGIFKHASINTAINHEVELHVCMTQDGTNVQSVEWLIGRTGGWQCMKWEGTNPGAPFFTELTPTGSGSPGAVNNGDRAKFRKVGTALTMHYDSGSGFTERWAVTSPFSSGSPGIAFFYRAGANVEHFGFTDVIIRPL